MHSLFPVATLTAGLTTGLLAGMAPAAAASSDNLVVSLETATGSGCPAGTVAAAVSPDMSAITVTYADYLVVVGGGTGPTVSRKSCQLTIAVSGGRQGVTPEIASVHHRGFGSLAAGATAQLRSGFALLDPGPVRVGTHPMAGPFDDNWQFTDVNEVAYADIVRPACGGASLRITTELSVEVGTADPATINVVAADAGDGSATSTYHLVWIGCG